MSTQLANEVAHVRRLTRKEEEDAKKKAEEDEARRLEDAERRVKEDKAQPFSSCCTCHVYRAGPAPALGENGGSGIELENGSASCS